jgi:hypothetical protein
MSLHADEQQMSYLAGASFHAGGESSVLTNAFIAANNGSIAAFRAAIGNITPPHAELQSTLGRQQRAVDYDGQTFGIGDMTNSNITGVTTNTGLVNLTQAAGTNGRLLMLE